MEALPYDPSGQHAEEPPHWLPGDRQTASDPPDQGGGEHPPQPGQCDSLQVDTASDSPFLILLTFYSRGR